MKNEIKLLKNNDKKECSDVVWVQEFYDFLQGKNPEGILCEPLNLTSDQAFTIIWYLQEHFPVFPDTIEKCDDCDDLFDTGWEGEHIEEIGKFFCSTCLPY